MNSRMKIMTTTVAVTLLSAIFLMPTAGAGQVIDRIVARVNGRIILESELDEALSYEALFSGKPFNQFSADDRRAVLDRLIDQELLHEQLKSSEFPHATEAEAASQIAGARKLYPEAATDEGWQAVLAKYGLRKRDLVSHVQMQIDLMRLVDAHLRPAVQVDSKSIEAYYRDKFVPQLKQAGASEVPLADVSGKIRELLTQEKVSELLVSWLQALRSESDVRIPGAAEASSREGYQSQ
jgi:peptidyl-prolyl cis-trans isomerase SurA